MLDGTAYCIRCEERVSYKTYERQEWIKILYKGEDHIVRFYMLEAYCPKCYSIIYAPEINDQNVDRVEEAVSRYKQSS